MNDIDKKISKEIDKIPNDTENVLFYLRTNGRSVCFQSTGCEGAIVDSFYSLFQQNPDVYRVLKATIDIIEKQKANLN